MRSGSGLIANGGEIVKNKIHLQRCCILTFWAGDLLSSLGQHSIFDMRERGERGEPTKCDSRVCGPRLPTHCCVYSTPQSILQSSTTAEYEKKFCWEVKTLLPVSGIVLKMLLLVSVQIIVMSVQIILVPVKIIVCVRANNQDQREVCWIRSRIEWMADHAIKLNEGVVSV